MMNPQERVVARANEVRTIKDVLEFLKDAMQTVMGAPVFQLILGIVAINALNRVSYQIEEAELDFQGKIQHVTKVVKLINDDQAALLTTLLISAEAAPLIQALFTGVGTGLAALSKGAAGATT